MTEIITEKEICDKLNYKYAGNCKYKVANAFIFGWESDFFVQKENGYAYEFEVKISRSDFFHDKQKIDKHLALQEPSHLTLFRDVINNASRNSKPNKFFYVVPENLVKESEVPVYAGLMYFTRMDIVTVKEAPFIHKEKMQFENVLCNKFYHYWINSKIKIRELENEIKHLKQVHASH
jgi:hypothetical protein